MKNKKVLVAIMFISMSLGMQAKLTFNEKKDLLEQSKYNTSKHKTIAALPISDTQRKQLRNFRERVLDLKKDDIGKTNLDRALLKFKTDPKSLSEKPVFFPANTWWERQIDDLRYRLSNVSEEDRALLLDFMLTELTELNDQGLKDSI